MSFDEIGKSIARVLVRYIQHYPFTIIGMKENSYQILEVKIKCKQCDEEMRFPLVAENFDTDSPFLTGMTITNCYYSNHYKHQEKEP
jgi:RNase P subunit RPR2